MSSKLNYNLANIFVSKTCSLKIFSRLWSMRRMSFQKYYTFNSRWPGQSSNIFSASILAITGIFEVFVREKSPSDGRFWNHDHSITFVFGLNIISLGYAYAKLSIILSRWPTAVRLSNKKVCSWPNNSLKKFRFLF